MHRPSGSIDGFSLLELLAALAIAAILLGLGTGGFGSLVGASGLSAVSSDLVRTVNLARSEALKRGLPVTLCASSDGAACSDSLDWQTGWVLVDDDGELIQKRAALSGRYLLTADVTAVRFLDSGFQAAGAAGFDLVDAACASGDDQARRLTIDRIGHVLVEQGSCT